MIKSILITIASLVVLVAFASFMAMNTPTRLSILVRIDNPEQKAVIAQGADSPYIRLVSFADTPMNEDVKILTIDTHPTPRDFFDNLTGSYYDSTAKWLDDIGVDNYPEIEVGR
jgi:hypothetical protein